MDKEIHFFGSILDLIVLFTYLLCCAMGRFYADLNKLKQNEIFSITVLTHVNLTSPIESFFKHQAQTQVDRCEIPAMAHAVSVSPPTSPFREMFNFEWLGFESSKSSNHKSPEVSPVSPSSHNRKLSMSTASPSSYFLDDAPLSPPTLDSSLCYNDQQLKQRTIYPSTLILPEPPSSPLAWVWQCHVCHSRYPLAVTRRCLIDGHYYCSGNSTQRNGKRHKANKSCTSEFDYANWQTWGQWRRKCMALKYYVAGKDEGPILTGCEGCNFPSQCRYEKRPTREKLDLEKYISDKDLEIITNNTNEPFKSTETTYLGKSLHDASTTAESQIKASGHSAIQSRSSKEQVALRNPSKLNERCTAGNAKSSTKRQRFYSSFTNNVTGGKSDPKRVDRGKFNTTLPSISAQVSVTSMPDSLDENKINVSHKSSDLEVAEISLKAALARQKSQQVLSSSYSERPSPNKTTSQPSLQKSRKKRINSKANNPEFEITEHDIKQHRHSTHDTTVSNTSSLPRTTSHQNLLADLFRQSKDKEHDKKDTEKARRAASEADIAAFLSPEISPVAKSTVLRRQSDEVKPQYFEQFDLLPP